MNRYKISVFFLFVLMLCTFSFVSASNELPLFGKIIYLDPGHGGTDPGAVYKDIHEADINLEIAKKLENILVEKGAVVYLTRYANYDLAVPNAVNRKRSDLSRRGNIINSSNCDLYISIHLNADSSSNWHGAQVFYDDVNEKNELLAKIMQEQLRKSLKTTRHYEETSKMYLHKRIKQPGILIEVGFLTNPNERYLLQKDDYQIKVSNAITNGIVTYFNQL